MDELNRSISISYSFFQAQKSTTWVCVSMSCQREKELTPNKMPSTTLLGIIISRHKSLLSGWFSISPMWDMLGPGGYIVSNGISGSLLISYDSPMIPIEHHPSRTLRPTAFSCCLITVRITCTHCGNTPYCFIQRHCRIWSRGCVQIK